MVSRRKAKKAEKMQLKAQGMTLDEARKIIYQVMDGRSVKNSDYKEALSLVEADDAEFAAEIKDFIAKKAKDDELREAYQIVGGYKKTISESVYNRAMKQVEADDPEFAAVIRELGGVRFAQAESEDLSKAELAVQSKKEAEQAAQALAYVNMDEILADEQVQELFDNTPAFTASGAQAPREDVAQITTAAVIADEAAEVAAGTASTEEPKKRFRLGFKKFFARLRVKESDGSIRGIKDAFNFKKKIRVSAKSVVESFRNSYNRATKAISNFAKRGFRSAAAWLNKSKEKLAMGAIKTATFLLLCTPLGCETSRNSGRVENPSQLTKRTTTVDSLTRTSAAIVSALPADSVAADTLAAKTAAIVSALPTDSVTADTLNAKPATVLTSATGTPITINELPTDTVFAADQFVINELPADTISGAAAQRFLSASDISADSVQFVSTRSEITADSTQIVTDSDSIPFGTPAAGYVAERGGYENRGVGNKKKYMNLRFKISSTWANELGVKAYDLIVEHIDEHPEVFRSKGTIGEGWTADQILQSYVTMRGAPAGYRAELDVLERLINPKGCDMSVSAAEIQAVNRMLAESNADNLRDGVLYNKPVRITNISLTNCNERASVTVVSTGQTNVTPNRTNGIKHPEYYMLPIRQPVKEEPIAIKWEKTDTIVETTIREVPISPEITLHRGSDFNVENTDSLGTVNIGDVTNITVTDNTRILVEKSDSSAPESSTAAVKPAPTKAKKGSKSKNQGNYDDLTLEQRAERLEAARRIVARGF